MLSPSGNVIPPLASSSVTQVINVSNPQKVCHRITTSMYVHLCNGVSCIVLSGMLAGKAFTSVNCMDIRL